jgi:hypothetical protein
VCKISTKFLVHNATLLIRFHLKTDQRNQKNVKINIVHHIFVFNIEQDGIKIMTIIILLIKRFSKKYPLNKKGVQFID